jgi:hypothetical protein
LMPNVSFGRVPREKFWSNFKKALKHNDLPTDFVTWSAFARDRPRWRLLTHSTPIPAFRRPTRQPQRPSPWLREPCPCLSSPDSVRSPRPSAIRRNARRQPRQRFTSAAESFARHRARQLKKIILKTFSTSSGCFVLGCQCAVARMYCGGL